MDNYRTLRRCDPVSVTSCVEIADIDFDGYDEIVLGNSRQVMWLILIKNEQYFLCNRVIGTSFI